MTQMRDELGKLGVHVDPSTKKRKSPKSKRVKPVAARQLVTTHGNGRAAEMLGLSESGLSTMISRDDAPLNVEKLAELIILNGGQTLQRQKTYLIVARVPQKSIDVVNTFLKALGIKSMEFGE